MLQRDSPTGTSRGAAAGMSLFVGSVAALVCSRFDCTELFAEQETAATLDNQGNSEQVQPGYHPARSQH